MHADIHSPSHQLAHVSDTRRVLLGLVFCVALGIVIPILLIEANGGGRSVPALLVLVTSVSGIGFSIVVSASRRRPHLMVFWLFCYGFLGVAPSVQYHLQSFPETTPGVDPTKFEHAAAVVLLGIAGVLFGGLLPVSQRSTRVAQIGSTEERANLLSVAAFGLGIVYILRIGIGNLFLPRLELEEVRMEALGDGPLASILYASVLMTGLVAFLAQWRIGREATGAPRGFRVLALVLLGIGLLVVANPLSTARYVSGTVLLAVVMGTWAYRTPLRLRILSVFSMIGLFVVFPMLHNLRYGRGYGATAGGEASLVSGDFDAFAQLVNTISLVETHGVSYGRQMLGVLLFWFPREAWPNKPLDTGVVVAEFMGYSFTNLSAPLWAELFINWGHPGVFAGMVLFGWLIKVFDQRFETDALSGLPPMPIHLVLPFYSLILLRGSLLQAMSYLGVLIAASYFVRSRRVAVVPR